MILEVDGEESREQGKSQTSDGELNDEPDSASPSQWVHSICLLWTSRTSGCQAVCQNQECSRVQVRQLRSEQEDPPCF